MLTDQELKAVSVCSGCFSTSQWAMYWSLLLNRKVTVEEVTDAFNRIAGLRVSPTSTVINFGSL